jgi:acetolactate synthase I/II/III large subunit
MNSVELSTAIADALAAAGADTVFGMPGGGNNLDFIGAAEAAGLRFVLAHAETPAAMMAAVYADLTDTPAACLVTRGPGAASAVNGIANALLDRQQLVLITDTVSGPDRRRIAHQRLDQTALFATVTKWSGTAGDEGITATAKSAIALAMTEPRGPVHLDFDPAAASASVEPVADPAPVDPRDLDRALALLSGSRHPVILLGVGSRRLVTQVRSLVRDTAIPALMTYRAKGVIPDSWPNAAGMLTGATTEAPLLEAADLIVMIGVDSIELIPNEWPYPAPVISVTAWPETSPYLVPQVELVGEPGALIQQLGEHVPATQWATDAGNAHRDAELDRLLGAGPAETVGLSPQEVVIRTRAIAPAGTLATVDAGAHMLPAMALWWAEEVDETLVSSGLATMGFSVPAAIGAALARPKKRVVCFTGDGGLGMSLGELETMTRLSLPITVVVFNDSRLSLIAIKAKPQGNGGDGAIGYASTDFAAVARGYGLAGERVTSIEELDAALTASFDRPGPTLVDAQVDPSGYSQILHAIRGRRSPQ